MTIYFYSAEEPSYDGFSAPGMAFDEDWWPSAEPYLQALEPAGVAIAGPRRQAAAAPRGRPRGRARSGASQRDWGRLKAEVLRRATAVRMRAEREFVLSISDGILPGDADPYYGYSGGGRVLDRILTCTHSHLDDEAT